MGTLGAGASLSHRPCCLQYLTTDTVYVYVGNHYCEIQVVDEIIDRHAASRMGIDQVGQVCVMIHR